MKKKAFTLIEVMVVLSILAIIAILAYNFFGSTMKEAVVTQSATKMFRDMTIIEDAYLEHIRKGGAEPSLTGVAERAAFKELLVTQGILKAFPEAKADWYTDSGTCAASNTPLLNGWGLAHANYGGSAENEMVYWIYCIADDICEKFNDLYTDLGTDTSPSHMDVELHGGKICSSGVGVNNNIVVGIAELN